MNATADEPLMAPIASWTWAVIILANLLLAALILHSPAHPVYDEGFYLHIIPLLEKYGLSANFLRAFPGPAGPLHTVVYGGFFRVFPLSFPYLRFFSFALLLAAAWILSRALSLSSAKARPDPRLTAAILTVLPTAGASAGMALTETPALLFAMLFLFAFVRSLSSPGQSLGLAWAGAAGVALGAAILGRQNYIMLLPGSLALLLVPGEFPRYAARVAALCVPALLIAAPVFILWGGFTPFKFDPQPLGIVPWNAVLAFGYAGVIAFLIAPGIVTPRNGPVLAAAAIVALAVWYFAAQSYFPLHSVLTRMFGEAGAAVAGSVFVIGISFAATLFAAYMGLHVWRHRGDALVLFTGASVLLGLASNMGITHQFSSRYVFVFLPFLLTSLTPVLRLTRFFPFRLAAGASISLLSLASYFGV